jgi:Family of unknown function (DUF6166)
MAGRNIREHVTITGRMLGNQAIITFDGRPLTPARSQRVWNHSPDGFSWGYAGSGPAQLALAILLEAGCSRELAVRLHQRFKFAYLATLPAPPMKFSIDVPVAEFVREWESQNHAGSSRE